VEGEEEGGTGELLRLSFERKMELKKLFLTVGCSALDAAAALLWEEEDEASATSCEMVRTPDCFVCWLTMETSEAEAEPESVAQEEEEETTAAVCCPSVTASVSSVRLTEEEEAAVAESLLVAVLRLNMLLMKRCFLGTGLWPSSPRADALSGDGRGDSEGDSPRGQEAAGSDGEWGAAATSEARLEEDIGDEEGGDK
jgi:hypothetical protein